MEIFARRIIAYHNAMQDEGRFVEREILFW